MKVLITGSGGREHALAWRVIQSPEVDRVFVAPGNGGTATEPGVSNVDIDVMDIPGQIAFARKEQIDLTIIGPEAPLVAGVVDQFTAANLRCFGPGAGAAQLEGSKSFTKDFLNRYNIPTAAYGSFENMDEAIEFSHGMDLPMVIKADGLAAGKGVVIAQSHSDAEKTIREMMADQRFGEAGQRVVIEAFLEGEEASFIVIADGENFVPFASSQDHKAIFDGDKGPNTGGMGAYSPAPVVTPTVHQRIIDRVIEPTIAGMRDLGFAYTGFLYAGVMIDEAGNPNVIEFNCRFGDPETQPMMMRMESDLVALCNAAIDGNLAGKQIEFSPQVALAVVLAAGGYPNDYRKGDEISGLDSSMDGKVFHAGTVLEDSKVLTNGGRVLAITTLGQTVGQAQQKAYEINGQISYADKYCRSDIGYRAVARESSKPS